MPATPAGSTILITGGSGFLGAWVVFKALERGHTVRTTVRSASKGDYLAQLFDKRHPGKFSYVIAEDLEQDGVFDDAVKGVDAVLHTASPFHFDTSGDPRKALIDPAINGTTNILKSIVAHGSNVKRVVITSSYAAILDSSRPPPVTYTEADWNKTDIEKADTLKEKQDGLSAYRASKTFAEKAAWEFVEAHQPAWDLATINPPLIFGPIIHQVPSPEKLNTSVANVWNAFHGKKNDTDFSAPGGSFVDVRDVADAHVEAAVRPDAGGQRFATSSGEFTWQQIADVIHTAPSSVISDDWKSGLAKGTPGEFKTNGNKLDASKSIKALGLKYLSLQQTILDTSNSLADYEKRGWKDLPSEDILYYSVSKE